MWRERAGRLAVEVRSATHKILESRRMSMGKQIEMMSIKLKFRVDRRD